MDNDRQVHRHVMAVHRGDMPPVRIAHMAVQVFVHIQFAGCVSRCFLLARKTRPRYAVCDRFAAEMLAGSTC